MRKYIFGAVLLVLGLLMLYSPARSDECVKEQTWEYTVETVDTAIKEGTVATVKRYEGAEAAYYMTVVTDAFGAPPFEADSIIVITFDEEYGAVGFFTNRCLVNVQSPVAIELIKTLAEETEKLRERSGT